MNIIIIILLLVETSWVGGQDNGYDGKETGGNQVGGGPREGEVRCYARQDAMGRGGSGNQERGQL